MFYVKAEISESITLKAEIEDNVFTICPVCGVEHQVDLKEILECPHADLCSTSVYCDACSQRREEQLRSMEDHHASGN